MYCVANVEVLRSKNDRNAISTRNEKYYYSLLKNRDLAINELTKKDIEAAFEHYAENNKS